MRICKKHNRKLRSDDYCKDCGKILAIDEFQDFQPMEVRQYYLYMIKVKGEVKFQFSTTENINLKDISIIKKTKEF